MPVVFSNICNRTFAGGVAAWYSQYAFVIGFPLGFVFYLVLMKIVVLPAYPQAEVGAQKQGDYLATSEGLSWAYLGQGRFERVAADLSGRSVAREDL